MARDEMSVIRVLSKTKIKIKILAEKNGLKEVTTLEYLLNGKISLKELND